MHARKFFRRRAVFIRDPHAHSTPLDRNDRARVLWLAESLERRTKAPGRKNGALGAVGVEMLRALFKRTNWASGICFPSYACLQTMTGRCRATVATALKRLEAAGIIRIIRWLKRIQVVRMSPVTGVMECVTITCQDSNLYAFGSPTALAVTLDPFAVAYTPPPPRQADDIGRLIRRLGQAESAARPETISLLNFIFGRK
jgi:hypothetical protein